MTPAVPRWGIAPGAVPLVRGPGGIARGTIVVAAARGFNGDSGSPTGGRDGQSEMRGAGRRDADPQVQWFGAADAPQQQAPAANGGTNANRGGPGGKGAPNPFVRRDASQGGSQGAAATAPGRGGAAPSTPVPSDLNKQGGQGASARAQQQQAARPAKPATPQAPPRTQAPRQTQAPATCPDPLPPIHRGRGSRRYRRPSPSTGTTTTGPRRRAGAITSTRCTPIPIITAMTTRWSASPAEATSAATPDTASSAATPDTPASPASAASSTIDRCYRPG